MHSSLWRVDSYRNNKRGIKIWIPVSCLQKGPRMGKRWSAATSSLWSASEWGVHRGTAQPPRKCTWAFTRAPNRCKELLTHIHGTSLSRLPHSSPSHKILTATAQNPPPLLPGLLTWHHPFPHSLPSTFFFPSRSSLWSFLKSITLVPSIPPFSS